MFHLRNRFGVNHCIEEKKINHISICFRTWKETLVFLECFSLKVELIQLVMKSIRGMFFFIIMLHVPLFHFSVTFSSAFLEFLQILHLVLESLLIYLRKTYIYTYFA